MLNIIVFITFFCRLSVYFIMSKDAYPKKNDNFSSLDIFILCYNYFTGKIELYSPQFNSSDPSLQSGNRSHTLSVKIHSLLRHKYSPAIHVRLSRMK